jgi:serine/threonine protein kinase
VQEKKRKPTTTTHPPTNQEIMDHQQVPSRVGKYELGDTLGEGTFAKVKHGKNKETGEIVAIKVIDKEKILKNKMVDQIKREISTMKMVKHPNIVQLLEVMASKTKIYIVMEYAKGGELFDKIVSPPPYLLLFSSLDIDNRI